MNRKLNVINMYAGPGAGKSTTAAGLFYKMKRAGYSVELVTEYAKEKVYEGFFSCLEDQIYIFAKQQRRLKRLVGEVKYAITDSPILNSQLYNDEYGITFDKLVLETYNSYKNLNFFIERAKPYVESGRTQTYEQACALDTKMNNILYGNQLDYHCVRGDEKCIDYVFNYVEDYDNKLKIEGSEDVYVD